MNENADPEQSPAGTEEVSAEQSSESADYDPIQNNPLTDVFGTHTKTDLVFAFIEQRDREMNRGEVIDRADISESTFDNYIEDLLDAGIVKISRSVGNIKFYTLNEKNTAATKIKEAADALVGQQALQSDFDALSDQLS